MNKRLNIKNLAQLKRALRPGVRFRVLRHHRKEMVGATKVVNIQQSNAVYVQIADQPDHPLSLCNGGRGTWMPYEKAPFYKFVDGVVSLYEKVGDEDSLVYSFEVLDEQSAA